MFNSTINRAACICLLVFAGEGVLSGDAVQRLDYDLLAAVEPLAESDIQRRPVSDEVLLLQFWASWCHSCGALMWDMDEIVSNNSGVSYLAVSLDDEVGDATEYIRRHSLYEKYKDRYFIATQITFTHVYFSGERSDDRSARLMAEQELRHLNESRLPFHLAASRGDHFLYHRNYVNKDQEEVVARDYVYFATYLIKGNGIPPAPKS